MLSVRQLMSCKQWRPQYACYHQRFLTTASVFSFRLRIPPSLRFCFYGCFRYDPSTGMYGMDFFVVLERPGYHVGCHHRCKTRVGIQHRVTKDDAMKWFQVKI